MSSNVCNNNNNASQLHIPQTASKFPLSSPTSDDQISSRSFESKRTASSSDLPSSPHSSQNPFGETDSGNTSGQDEFHLERYSESSTLARNGPTNSISGNPSRDGQQGQNAVDTKKKKPDLNLVTSFSKTNPHVPAEHPTINRVPVRQPRWGEGKTASTAKSQTGIKRLGEESRFANPGFVSLNDLEGLRKNKRSMTRPKAGKGSKKSNMNVYKANQEVEEQNPSSVSGELPSNPSLRRFFQKEQAKPLMRDRDNKSNHLQAPEQESNEISPTARSVVFGISVPENEVEAHKPSHEMSSALTLQTPITPSIVVTPADATVGWTQSAMQGSQRRPASSIYSQITGIAYKQDADAPPVPSLPSCLKEAVIPESESCRHSVDTWEVSSLPKGRPFSSETIIEEDYSQQPLDRPVSAGSRDEILPLSCDTGRPRSKGWWNLMLSPMLSRAGTNATKKTISPSQEVPALPCINTATGRGLGLDEQTPTDDISPETPRRAGLESVRNSTWSNWTQWEQDREQAQSSPQSSECAAKAESKTVLDNEPDQSCQVAVDGCVKKSGLATEYYQACAFDLLNPIPYFECANHDCANALPKLSGSPKGVVQAEHSNDDLGLDAKASMNKHIFESSSPPGETRLRSDSDSTIIEDDPIELSPNVRKAHAKPFLKAAHPQKVDASSPNNDVDEKQKTQEAVTAADEADVPAPKSSTPPPYSPPPAKPFVPRYVGIMPPDRQFVLSSPGPLSPEAHKALNPGGGISMSHVHQPAPTFVNFNTTYPADLPPRPVAACVSLADIENPMEVRQKAEARRRRLEQEDAVAHKAGGLWRGRGCLPKRGCYGREGSAGRTRRRWHIVIATSLVLMIILIVVLATQLTRKGDQTPVQSQWLNLTGYPPMPTGISTIAKPDAASTVTACVQPSSLWSCALPREDQASNAPSNSDQPNFRLEIRFRNGTVNANGTVPLAGTNDKRATGLQHMALVKRQNDPFTNSLFEPNPAPPSLAEQEFIGNTTDNNTVPFNGEPTPFFLTLLTSDPAVPESFNDTNESPKRRLRRQAGSESGSIPAPAVLLDGTAAPANLLPDNPLPFSQPVMLYNRGLESEHYGFYTYFDRSIFIKSSAAFNSSSSSTKSGGEDPDNSSGGSSKQDADLRCTWAQTRFLVQIWTNPKFGQLLPSANGTATSSGPANTQQGAGSSSGQSSPTDFNRPGSFPYPVSVTLDRHGGDSAKKGVYCYGMDGQQKILVSEKKLVAELRDAGGLLINAAPGIFSNTAGNDDGFDAKAGGIDGGTGGCGCEWRNWVGNGG